MNEMNNMTTTTSAMDKGPEMSMTMSNMAMTFFTSSKTPLYSNSWTPSSTGEYAGACVFLIVLAVILRLLIALRPILEGRLWMDGAHRDMGNPLIGEERQKTVSSTKKIVQETGRRWSMWRMSPAAGRATYEVVIGGIAYLL